MIKQKDVYEHKSTRDRFVIVEVRPDFIFVQKLYSNSSHQDEYFMITAKNLAKDFVKV